MKKKSVFSRETPAFSVEIVSTLSSIHKNNAFYLSTRVFARLFKFNLNAISKLATKTVVYFIALFLINKTNSQNFNLTACR